MPGLDRRDLLRALGLTVLVPSLAHGRADERFGFDFERRQATRDGLTLLVLVLPPGRKQRESDGILWGDFFSCASHEQLADVALVRVTSSLLKPLQDELPQGCEPLPADTVLALYAPGEHEPRIVRRAHLPSSCRGDFTLRPWSSPAVPPGLDRALRAFIHPSVDTITARLGALERVLSQRGESLPSERLLIIALHTRLAAESAQGDERAELLAATGAHFEWMLRRYPAEGLSWSGLVQRGLNPCQFGPCGVGHVPNQSRRFLRYYLDAP